MPNKLIMLVEDDDSVRFIARRMIESSGYKVEDFAHGLSAYRKLVELHNEKNTNHYRMILSDIDMPEMDGIAFARECAAVAKETPLVLMTGKPREHYPENVKEVLNKPFSSQECKQILALYAHQRN